MPKTYTIAEAAKLLGVDERTLNRWMRKQRIIARQDPRDKRRHLLTETEVKQLEKAFKRSSFLASDEIAPLKEEIFDLREALQALKERLSTLQRQVDDLAELTHDLRRGRSRDSAPDESGIIPDLMSHGPSDAVQPLRVRDNIRAAIDFIRRETRDEVAPPNTRSIYIIHQRDHSVFSAAHELRAEWWRVLRGAVDRGWELVHLIRRAQDGIDTEHLGRPRMLAKAVMALLGGAGNYTPQYFYLTPEVRNFYPEPFERDNLREFIVVSGQGAGELYSMTDGAHSVDRFVECKAEDERFHRLNRYAREAFMDSRRVLKTYNKGSAEFAEAMATAEGQDGGRVLFMRGLSQSTIPWDIHDQRAQSVNDTDWAQRMVKSLKDREDALLSKLNRGRSIREICTEEAIKNYVETGIYAVDDPFLAKDGRIIKKSERRAHLQSVIERLEQYSNYELAFVTEDVLKQLDVNLATWWMVEENFSVLFEAWRHTAAVPPSPVEVDLEISDHDIVTTLWSYFQNDIWGHLPQTCTDRGSVIRFLKWQISRISPEN